MATEAIIHFARQHANIFLEPVLEIGSKIQPGYKQFSPRDIHSQAAHYVGIDICAGEGVDQVLDLTQDKNVELLGEGKFNTIYCLCVLEHVPNIFSIARNIERMLKVGGKLFVSVPFAWKIHRIPCDMWRFTPQSIDYLFPRIEFKKEWCGISTRHVSKVYDIDSAPELDLGSGLSDKRFFLNFFIKFLRKLKLDEGYFSHHRALMVESNLMMIGEKQASPSYTFISKELLNPVQ